MLGVFVAYVAEIFIWKRAGKSWRDSLRFRVTLRGGPSVGNLRHMVLIPIVVLVVLMATPKGFWLPLEKIKVDNSHATGYILQSKDGWSTFMSEDRALYRFPTDAVTERQICGQGEYLSLVTLLLAQEVPKRLNCK